MPRLWCSPLQHACHVLIAHSEAAGRTWLCAGMQWPVEGVPAALQAHHHPGRRPHQASSFCTSWVRPQSCPGACTVWQGGGTLLARLLCCSEKAGHLLSASSCLSGLVLGSGTAALKDSCCQQSPRWQGGHVKVLVQEGLPFSQRRHQPTAPAQGACMLAL